MTCYVWQSSARMSEGLPCVFERFEAVEPVRRACAVYDRGLSLCGLTARVRGVS